jgi:hypothetical protein
MSMAGGLTPYGQATPGGGGGMGRQNAPYTPTANTPYMTPMGTPGKKLKIILGTLEHRVVDPD